LGVGCHISDYSRWRTKGSVGLVAPDGRMIYQAISCHDLIGPSRLKQPPAQQKVDLCISRPRTTTRNHKRSTELSSGFPMGPNKEAEGSEPAPITPGGTYSIQVCRVSRRRSLSFHTTLIVRLPDRLCRVQDIHSQAQPRWIHRGTSRRNPLHSRAPGQRLRGASAAGRRGPDSGRPQA